MSSSADSSIPKPLAAPGRTAASNQMAPLSGLENALDTGGEEAKRALSEALARVDDLAGRTKGVIASGANRAEYARLSALARACETAKQILAQYTPKGGT